MQPNTTVHDAQLEYLESLFERLKNKRNDAVSPKNQDEVELLKCCSVQLVGHAVSLGRTLKNFAIRTSEAATAAASVASTPLGQVSIMLSSLPFVGIPFHVLAKVLEARNNAQKVEEGIASYVGRLSDLTEGLHEIVKQVADVGGEDVQRDTTFYKLKDVITDGINALAEIEEARTSKCNYFCKCIQLWKAKGQLDKLKSINADLDSKLSEISCLKTLEAIYTRKPEMRNLWQETRKEIKDDMKETREDIKEIKEDVKQIGAPCQACRGSSATQNPFPKRNFAVPRFSCDEYVSIRESDLEDIKYALLNIDQACVVVRGFQGIGKSWLVRRVATLNDVVEKFHSGILWIKIGHLGMTARALVGLLRKVYDHVKSTDSALADFEDIDSGILAINAIVAKKKSYLFVLDDVWETRLLEPFARIQSTVLVTTRKSLAPRQREKKPLKCFVLRPKLNLKEAVDLLQHASRVAANDSTPAIAERLGRHAFTLRIVAKLVPHPFSGSWNKLREKLKDRPSLNCILERSENDTSIEEVSDSAIRDTAFKMIDLSLKSLAEVTPTCFFQLSILARDANFSVEDYRLLGNEATNKLSKDKCEMQLSFLEGASLLHKEGDGVYSLHPIAWEFCFERLGKSGREGLHEMLIRNWIKNDNCQLDQEEEEWVFKPSPIPFTDYIKENMFRHIKRSHILNEQLTDEIYRNPKIPFIFSNLGAALLGELKFTKALPCLKLALKVAKEVFEGSRRTEFITRTESDICSAISGILFRSFCRK